MIRWKGSLENCRHRLQSAWSFPVIKATFPESFRGQLTLPRPPRGSLPAGAGARRVQREKRGSPAPARLRRAPPGSECPLPGRGRRSRPACSPPPFSQPLFLECFQFFQPCWPAGPGVGPQGSACLGRGFVVSALGVWAGCGERESTG